MVFNFATVNLSDFSCSALILLTSSLEAMSLLGILIVLWGCVVQVVAAVVYFRFGLRFAVVSFRFGLRFSGFALGGLPHFLLTCAVSNDLVS